MLLFTHYLVRGCIVLSESYSYVVHEENKLIRTMVHDRQKKGVIKELFKVKKGKI